MRSQITIVAKEPAGSRLCSLSSPVSRLCLETLVKIIFLDPRLDILFSESRVTIVNHNTLLRVEYFIII